MSEAPSVHFGGPDQPPGALRDLLEARVSAVPEGGMIDWMTYYFRDERLANALVAAHRRGVRVRVCLEGRPRLGHANDAVVARLRSGIGDRLRVERRLFGASHLHTKVYCFSDPRPHALVGSFNPSGNIPEDPAVIADIGDQDRGHNLLVELNQTALVQAFVDRIAAIHAGASPFGSLASPALSRIRADGYEACFFPARGSNPLDERLARIIGAGARLRIAASHVRDRRVARQLTELAAKGVAVELLTHHTLRRSPAGLVERLRAGGVAIRRYRHPEDLPMHAKFILAESAGGRWSAFGSYNLTRTSRALNQELLVFADDAGLWKALDARWMAIAGEPWSKP